MNSTSDSVLKKFQRSLDRFRNDRSIVKANFLKENGIYPYFRKLYETAPSTVVVNDKKQVMIGSNNYLGLTHHPYVKEMAIKAIEKYGTGCTGSRLLNGNLAIHEELEERLAKFVGQDSALVFATGMQANLGAISSILGPRDAAFSDLENHASLIDGLRLGGTTYKYKHNNLSELEELLETYHDRYERLLIVTDGVFSMTGDLAPLPEIVTLAKKYGALVYVDDAHGIGMIGRNGRGTPNFFNLNSSHVSFHMGTFSKSFASMGGFIAGSKDSINYIRHVARAFIFSAALAPSQVATVLAALDLMERDESLFSNLFQNVRMMKEGFDNLGLNTLNSNTAIIPILIGDDLLAMKMSEYLLEEGVFVTPVIAPATPPGMALLRTSYSSSHTREELEFVLKKFEKAIHYFNLKDLNVVLNDSLLKFHEEFPTLVH